MDRAMVFGKYCLLERISVGGMAEVFRAKPLPARGSNKYLALKRILPHLAEDEEFITMFVDEAKLTVQLEHPNIVETYELGSFQSSHYILMEFIPGADVLSLQKRLREQRKIMSVAQACYVASKVGRGLHSAHTATDEQGRPFNIIHRDVSPQNIRLTFDGRVKLIDFGIAKAAVQRTKTKVGVLKGKFGYMSPEQVRGEAIDHRSDVFALGTTFWEMLTNRRLFNGENEFETLQMVKHPDIPRPSEKNSQVPAEVDEIVMRALAEDRDERFQTAAEFAEALEDFNRSIPKPYTRRHLTDWMAETYSGELAEERRKRELYEEIQTVDDVAEFNEKYADEPKDKEAAQGEPVAGTAEVDGGDTEVDDRVWDPDFAPDTEEDVDHEEFATNHTVVAAGGFDPQEFEDETDEVTSVGEEPHLETRETDEMGEVEPTSPGEVEPDDTVPIEEGRVDARDDTEDREGNESRSGPPPLEELAEGTAGRDAEEGPAGNPAGRNGDFGEPGPTPTPGPTLSESGRASAPEDERARRSRRLKIASAVAAVVVLAGLSGALGYVLLASDEPGDGSEHSGKAGKAQLVVDVTPKPTAEGEIAVDGEVRGRTPPLTLSGLDPGTHVVALRFPGFEAVEREVELESGELGNVSVQLEGDPDDRGRVALEVSPEEAEPTLFVDGERLETGALATDLSPGRHLVEVVAEGFRTWSRVVELSSGDHAEMSVTLEPVDASLNVEVDGDAVVLLDGEDMGSAPVELTGLDPSSLHELTVRPSAGEGWETTLGFPLLGRETLALSVGDWPESRDESDYGELEVETGEDWWNIGIDGYATGLRTPVTGTKRIPVEAGERSLTLRRGGDVHEIDIEVDAGNATEVALERHFEWKTGD